MDLTLAARCRDGAAGAFEELYRLHAPRLYGLARRLVGPDEADDMLQEIFLTVHRKLALFRGESSLSTWLFRLGTNVCLDHLRSRAMRTGRLNDALDDEFEDGAGAGPILGVIARLDLERALDALPPRARTVFVLHDVEGLEHQDVASLLGISEGTSKSQLHKARMRLRQQLRPRTHDGVAS
ncbi:MAG: RNA polymerase sigma factor [Acidobacteria bacterium]|nr:RNA polymerase sigma factor [Acidobacteriota bacterium]